MLGMPLSVTIKWIGGHDLSLSWVCNTKAQCLSNLNFHVLVNGPHSACCRWMMRSLRKSLASLQAICALQQEH